jgi:mycothiol synthase
MGKTGGKIMREPRPYRDEHDLQGMCDLLVAGRKAANGTYYIHTGDLRWWLYYPPLEGDFWNDIYLWDDPDEPDRLLGWALLSVDWVGFDVYVQPELRGSQIALEMYTWAEQMAVKIAREKHRQTISCLWVFHDDEVLDRHFIEHGFHRARGMLHMTRSLDGGITPHEILPGFKVRSCEGEAEVAGRAQAQFGAFTSHAPFEQYLARFRNFMRSPVYDRDLDIVAAAQDGHIGAFSIIWLDSVNQVGLFEPVGTHPDFQRKGLGRAVLQEGLRRMQARNMKQAIVSVYEDNLPAKNLYESLGFQVVNWLGTYEKDV